ncbi:MAG TPA: response regulator transcription factor [Terriglobales bacterium]|nr:response regulator transcription factor [Terriglobales bacterium]
MEKRIGVAIIDDHAILRSGLRMLINAQNDMYVVAEGSNASDLWRILNSGVPNVVLLDIGLPGKSGLQVIEQVREKDPAVKVIILTMHRDLAMVRSALASGAAGFVSKESADTDLLSAIRAVQKGGLVLDPEMAKHLLQAREHIGTVQADPLSERERQVVKLLARGLSNQEIAAHISISVKTVETYRARIAEKIGMRTRTDIARYAFATGMLNGDDFLNNDLRAA